MRCILSSDSTVTYTVGLISDAYAEVQMASNGLHSAHLRDFLVGSVLYNLIELVNGV